MSDTPYINNAAVKKIALRYSRRHKSGKFTRVGSSFFDKINAQVAAMVMSELRAEEPPLVINRTTVKKLAAKVKENTGSENDINGVVLDRINRRIIEIIEGEVFRHRYVGKTLT